MNKFSLALCSILACLLMGCQSSPSTDTDKPTAEPSLDIKRIKDAKPRNVIFILSDDHRYDFMGFTGKVPWLQTPNMDRMAQGGAYCPNAFVTTSLCSPSRASILTGLYTHSHTVVDNQAPNPGNLTYFPQYLQAAGYETAFFGKWHMGDHDDSPQPGFDHWESFKGQGTYYKPELNINGQRVQYPDSTYISDLLTEHAIEWLSKRKGDKPYFIYLSHKAVHASFRPAKRHLNEYENEQLIYPPSFNTSKDNVKGTRGGDKPLAEKDYYGPNRTPDWQRMQRESWHGVDYMYHGEMDFETFFRRYCETLKGIDESIGNVMDHLQSTNQLNSTLLLYMGDNGFSFGEHGLIDKRHFYEESVKVPLLVHCPELRPEGQNISQMLQNIDIGPTILEAAGLQTPEHMQGRSFLPLLQQQQVAWRDKIFYEYYWEYDFPHTPTIHGVRTDRYKYIRYHGVWDTNEFYDLQEDPDEMNNLIASPEHQDLIKSMAGDIYDWLESTDGLQIPLKRTIKPRWGDHRNGRNAF
ncbi:MAG: sulfatase [Bacteroidota bacterium]